MIDVRKYSADGGHAHAHVYVRPNGRIVIGPHMTDAEVKVIAGEVDSLELDRDPNASKLRAALDDALRAKVA